MSDTITVATANAFYGALVKDPDGFRPFAERDTDVVLLQEVLNVPRNVIDYNLKRHGYTMDTLDEASGLAIALKDSSGIKAERTKIRIIQPIGLIGACALKLDLPHAQRFRPRSFISSVLEMPDGRKAQVATAHPIVFAKPIARRRQLALIAEAVNRDRQAQVPIILAADMNHYHHPGP